MVHEMIAHISRTPSSISFIRDMIDVIIYVRCEHRIQMKEPSFEISLLPYYDPPPPTPHPPCMFHQIKPISPVCTFARDIPKLVQFVIAHQDVGRVIWLHGHRPLILNQLVRRFLRFRPILEVFTPRLQSMDTEDLNPGAILL